MFRSLTLVLEGNIPRFSWEPSTTMLTNRLSGTTEISVSNRIGRAKSGGSSASPHAAVVDQVDSTIFLRHGARRGAVLLTTDQKVGGSNPSERAS